MGRPLLTYIRTISESPHLKGALLYTGSDDVSLSGPPT